MISTWLNYSHRYTLKLSPPLFDPTSVLLLSPVQARLSEFFFFFSSEIDDFHALTLTHADVTEAVGSNAKAALENVGKGRKDVQGGRWGKKKSREKREKEKGKQKN